MSRHDPNDPKGMHNPSQEEISRWWDHFETEDDLFKEEQLKDKYAFALSLDDRTGLPRVTAMGRGLFATRIEQRAQESGLQVEKDPDMVKRLFKPTDENAIHPRIYGVIAEILTFVYQINEKATREGLEAGEGEYLPEELVDETEETGEEFMEAGESCEEETAEEYPDEDEFEEELILEDYEEIN